jgi:hypothetical protein
MVKWLHRIGVRVSKNRRAWDRRDWKTVWANGNSVEYYETFVAARVFEANEPLRIVGRQLSRRFNTCAEGWTLQWGFNSVAEARGSGTGQCHPWAAAIYTWNDPMRFKGRNFAATDNWLWHRYYANEGLGPGAEIPKLRW